MTDQIGDSLIYDGRTLDLVHYPAVPEDHPSIVMLPGALGAAALGPSYLQRGYVATWSVIDDYLWLSAIDSDYWLLPNGPVRADWLNYTLTAATGPYVENEWGHQIPTDVVRLRIEEGEVVDVWEADFRDEDSMWDEMGAERQSVIDAEQEEKRRHAKEMRYLSIGLACAFVFLYLTRCGHGDSAPTDREGPTGECTTIARDVEVCDD